MQNTAHGLILQLLEYNNVTTVSNSFFNASSPTKVIIHGFGSSCDKVWAREMRLSFLAVVSFNWKEDVVDPQAGGVQCDLRGLGGWGSRPKLCEGCRQHQAGWEAGDLTIPGSGQLNLI